MSEKPKQLTIRLSADEAEALQAAAAREFRSLNDQVRWLLSNALKTQPGGPEDLSANL